MPEIARRNGVKPSAGQKLISRDMQKRAQFRCPGINRTVISRNVQALFADEGVR